MNELRLELNAIMDNYIEFIKALKNKPTFDKIRMNPQQEVFMKGFCGCGDPKFSIKSKGFMSQYTCDNCGGSCKAV